MSDIDTLEKVINPLSDLVVFNHDNFDEFLKKLMKVILEIVPVDSCLIYFYDRQKKELTLIGSKKPHPDAIGTITLQKGEGITGWSAEHQKTVAIEEKAYEDRRFKSFKQLPEDKFESFLSVPIIDETGVIGVINLQNRTPYQFSKMQIKTVESLVKIIASAFVKVILTRKVTHLENKLEERKAIEKAKGVLMKVKKMDENEAFTFLRKEAMLKRKSMKQIADAVLLVMQ